MPDIDRYTTKFRALPTTKVVRRPRPSTVCSPCRRNKLKCDRNHPCGNCIRRGEDGSCTYQGGSGPGLDSYRNVVADERLQHLESLVKQLMETKNPASSQPVYPSPGTPPFLSHDFTAGRDQAVPLGDSYVGSTHWSAMLQDIQELKTVLAGSAGPQEDVSPTSEGSQAPVRRDEPIFGSADNICLDQILTECLPPKIETDRLLATYFRGTTFIVPFLHWQHFQRQYREFWADTTNVNPLWLSLLFSICFSAYRAGDASTTLQSSHSPGGIDRATLHTAAGKCLVLGEYHRPQENGPEALALYAHCKNLLTLDPSREATAILSMAVRLAYEMGYHRDPDIFGTFTPFQGEMRRRFWAGARQMDMMMSFMLGLPSIITGNYEMSDTKSPRNLADSDFDTDTKILPPSRPENESTKILWFIVKERLMPNFSKVCQDALSFKEKTEADIMQLDQDVRQMHSTIPDVLRTKPISESIADDPFLIVTRMYIDLIYLKSLCVLHRKYMARGIVFSTQCCVDAGKSIVGQIVEICREFSPGGLLQAENWMMTNMTMSDFLLGVMVLCMALTMCSRGGAIFSAIDDATQSETLTLLEQALPILVERTPVSRDARRVSHAVRLTLNGRKKARASLPPFSTSVPPLSEERLVNQSDPARDPSTLLLPAHSEPFLEDEMAFDQLDPFNFMGMDFESFDWSIADPGVFDQGT